MLKLMLWETEILTKNLIDVFLGVAFLTVQGPFILHWVQRDSAMSILFTAHVSKFPLQSIYTHADKSQDELHA